MKINLLCGDRHLPKHLLEDKSEEEWGGIDRGALILIEHEIEPIFSLGDFDSVTDEERSELKTKLDINPVKAEKADTDLGLGVKEAVECGFDEIDIYGATGGRLDHFLGAVQLLQVPEYVEAGIVIRIIDTNNEISYLEKGEYHMTYDKHMPYVSFVPQRSNTVISLTGFKYPLQNQTLHQSSTLAISNEIAAYRGTIEVESGGILAIRSRDAQHSL
ncbi:thiamine diphosphokinase [Staphylococcus simulans]|uniref:thiamine diphosphokinase n=1 Tax=Staphylococcus simulans TaxID=1286 RepID=UPI000F6D5B58|nr:thiamine diphosphokinase [Staphylococcus simulans]VED60669.1 putative thiamine pyrophosphokinase [Staphylococcus simulans]